MNIRDSYIHGADGKGVVKSLFFVTAADVQADNNLHLNDLGVTLADANNSTFYLTIPTLNLNTTGYAALILTESKTNNSNYYLTFVGSNNTNGAAALSVYTNVNMYFNPGEGPTGHKGTLHVNNISGDNIGITIGNTFVTLGGTYTPVTSITASSTDDDIPSAAAVWAMLSSGLQANDAMIFKGVLNGGTNTTYTPAAECGHVYKVAVAGKINGDYYEVGDTLICAVDNTAAATSSNVSTVKTNWYAIQTNIADYLLKTGGTMTGNLKWKDTTALPTINSMANANILVVDGMDANTEGTTKQISLTSLLSSMDLSPSIGAGTGTNTVKITVNGTDSSDYTIPYATSATNLTGGALGSIPYLTAEGTTQLLAGGSNNLVLRYDGTNKKPYWGADVNTWRNIYVSGTSKVGNGTDTKAINYSAGTAISLGFTAAGTGTGLNANYFSVIISGVANDKDNPGYVAAPKSGSNYLVNKVWKTDANGNPAWRDDANTWVANAVGVAGYVAAPNATNDKNKFWKTDGNGNPAWTTVSIASAEHTHSVTINGLKKTIEAPGGNSVNLGNYLALTTYDWYFERSGHGSWCLGKFCVYDSTVIITIKSGNGSNHVGTIVINTFNKGTSGGTFASYIWGDSTGTLTDRIKIYNHVPSDPLVEVYYTGDNYTKMFVHILALNLQQHDSATASYASNYFDIGLKVDSVPTEATIHPTNMYLTSTATWALSTTGNAATATALLNSRNLMVDLSSSTALAFDGSSDATSIGVTGVLSSSNLPDLYWANVRVSDQSLDNTFPKFDRIALVNKTDNWNVSGSENCLRFLLCGNTAAEGAPSGYCSGLSIMTTYVGFQLAVYGGGDNKLFFRKKQDNGNWWGWYQIYHTGNLSVFKASGTNHSSGLVPDPGETEGNSKYLCENGTWSNPFVNGTDTIYNNNQTLTVSTWTTIKDISTYEAGTYAISISASNLYASGIFSICGGTDVMIDEIVLHVSNKTGGATWRPYARVSGKNLQLSCNETTGTLRTYTVKILKLI